MAKVLVTQADTASAKGLIRRFREAGHDVVGAGMLASTPAATTGERWVVVPSVDHPEYVPTLLDSCTRLGVEVVVPTDYRELHRCVRAERQFKAADVTILGNRRSALDACLDRYWLYRQMQTCAPVGRFGVFDEEFDAREWVFPLVVKSRISEGDRVTDVVFSRRNLADLPQDGSLIVQEHLPGRSCSVDVLSRKDGSVVICVPRERVEFFDGSAVVTRTIRDFELESYARFIAERLLSRYVSRVSFKRDRRGVPVLLDVRPLVTASDALTAASGVDMPLLALNEALGEPPPQGLSYRDAEMVTRRESRVCPSAAAVTLAAQTRARATELTEAV